MEDENIFIQELKKGYSWQLWVALNFLQEGFLVWMPELKIRNTENEINNYSDEGDIFVFRKRAFLRFECKSRALKFTCLEDYPFKTVIVERTKTWERKQKIKPFAIILISQETGKLIVAPSLYEKEWKVEEKEDHIRNYKRDYFIADKKYLRNWHQLINFIKEKK